MAAVEQLITDNLNIWTDAIKSKAAVGRGRGKGSSKYELYGIKKLRELILELAVRGLLVPQDPNDEPASELLKKIAVEKEQLIKDKKIKKSNILPDVSDEEKPYELPDGWAWARLQEVGHDLGQKKPDKEFTYIDVGAINKNLGYIESPNILRSSEAPSRARKLVKNGTIIYSTVRPYLLNIAVIDEDFEPEPIASTAFAIIHPLTGINESYVYRYLRSPVFVTYVESVQTGIAYPAINDKQFFSGLIPLAPTSEQQRIVARVDELMALCDQLEQQTEASLVAHKTLVEILLAALLTNVADNANFTESWKRIAEHFDTLFTTEYSVDQLKKTILQLAIMGKLVPQNPNDEPASELLKKIASEKEKLIKEKKIKKQKALPQVTAEEKLFELPEGWEWCRLQHLVTLLGDGLHGTPDYDDSGTYYFINGNNLNDGVINIKPETKRVNEDEYLKYKKELNSRTVFVSINGTLGNVAFYNDEPVMLGKSACYFNLGSDFPKLYFKRLIESPYFLKYAFSKATGSTIKNLGLKAMNDFPVALPPLEEQHMITTKVDEIMTLCDQLKKRIDDTNITQLNLANTIVEKAVA